MRPLRFWIAAIAIALAVGAITALWPPGTGHRPIAPPGAALVPPAPTRDPGAAPAMPSPGGQAAPRAAAPPPAPPAGREAGPAPDPMGEPSREFVRDSLKDVFTEKLPDRRLTEEEYDKLADAILRMRAARRKMSALAVSPENAAELERLREELNAAAADFEYVSELSPGAFTALAEPDLQPVRESARGGKPPGKDEEVTFEYLRDTPPR